MFVLRDAGLFKMRDNFGGGLCPLAGIEDKVIFTGAVDGAVDLVERGDGTEGEE